MFYTGSETGDRIRRGVYCDLSPNKQNQKSGWQTTMPLRMQRFQSLTVMKFKHPVKLGRGTPKNRMQMKIPVLLLYKL